MDINAYYQQELHNLRVLAAEFSKKHPDLAPLLAESSSDPDVERLLEGTAFLTAQLSKKFTESYDQIAENLCSLLLPQLLCDVPSCTLMQFFPTKNINAPLTIPAGSRVGSVETNGVSCTFSTTSKVELLPISLSALNQKTQAGSAPSLELVFNLHAPDAFQGVDRLRLYFPGRQANAVHRFYDLLFHTKSLSLQCDEKEWKLGDEALQTVGFYPDEELFPYPKNAWTGFRIIQEYYAFQEKFLFLDIMLPKDFHTGNAKNLACRFILKANLPNDFPEFELDNFALFATPAINIFPFETMPIKANLKESSYLVRANATQYKAYIPYKINALTAINAQGEEQEYSYMLAASHNEEKPTYTVIHKKNADEQRNMHIFLIHSNSKNVPERAVLSVDALYSNGDYPCALQIGDIKVPLSTSPALANFTNLTPPTKSMKAPAEGHVLWSMLAHLHLNYLPLTDAKSLKAILLTYLPTQFDAIYIKSITKHIESILSVEQTSTDILWKGRPHHSADINIVLDTNAFSNSGYFYLFGMILARFLHEYAPINNFMRVIVSDSLNTRSFQWQKHKTNPSLL